MSLEPKSPLTASQRMEYTCPMHPEVIQKGPGSCPICGDLPPKFWSSMRVSILTARRRRKCMSRMRYTAEAIIAKFREAASNYLL